MTIVEAKNRILAGRSNLFHNTTYGAGSRGSKEAVANTHGMDGGNVKAITRPLGLLEVTHRRGTCGLLGNSSMYMKRE